MAGLLLGGVYMHAGESHLAKASACLAPSPSPPSGAELPGTQRGWSEPGLTGTPHLSGVLHSSCLKTVTRLVVTLAAGRSRSEVRKQGRPSHPHWPTPGQPRQPLSPAAHGPLILVAPGLSPACGDLMGVLG